MQLNNQSTGAVLCQDPVLCPCLFIVPDTAQLYCHQRVPGDRAEDKVEDPGQPVPGQGGADPGDLTHPVRLLPHLPAACHDCGEYDIERVRPGNTGGALHVLLDVCVQLCHLHAHAVRL